MRNAPNLAAMPAPQIGAGHADDHQLRLDPISPPATMKRV